MSCPHCGGEIKASVIKCVHCGTSLVGEEQPATVPAGATGGTQEAVASAPVPKPKPTGDPWVTPSVRADGHAPLTMLAEAPPRSVPARSRQLDARLMAAGVLAIAAAVAAYSAPSLPWVAGRVFVLGQRSNARLTAELTFRASDSLAAPFALGVAAGMALLGLLWFWYGMDRGTYLPAIAHPALAAVAGMVALGTLAASKLGSFFWQDAFLTHARDAGLTKEAMRTLLEGQPAPVIELEQLSGMVRFAAAAALALVAGLVAWWSQHRRGFA
ncbi:MAG: hypothetical protein ACXWWL_07210 [Candidatus Limnocylindria bacterium]